MQIGTASCTHRVAGARAGGVGEWGGTGAARRGETSFRVGRYASAAPTARHRERNAPARRWLACGSGSRCSHLALRLLTFRPRTTRAAVAAALRPQDGRITQLEHVFIRGSKIRCAARAARDERTGGAP